jgi:hypothetical protein
MDQSAATLAAADYAKQAASVASTLKPGTYEAAQALALVSIAHSLAVLAENSRDGA